MNSEFVVNLVKSPWTVLFFFAVLFIVEYRLNKK